jgi:hypothetical protein
MDQGRQESRREDISCRLVYVPDGRRVEEGNAQEANSLTGKLNRHAPAGKVIRDSAQAFAYAGSGNHSFCDVYGGRCRIRTCDFHRVKVALYR